MDQNPTVPVTAQSSTKPPLGIKIMASLLLLVGLWVGFDVLSGFPAVLLFRSIPLIVFGVIGIILFIFTEKTAMGLFKLKTLSRKNYYITLSLDALYFAAKSQLAIFLLVKKTPPAQIYLMVLLVTLIIFAILALPFFLVTRKHIGLFK